MFAIESTRLYVAYGLVARRWSSRCDVFPAVSHVPIFIQFFESVSQFFFSYSSPVEESLNFVEFVFQRLVPILNEVFLIAAEFRSYDVNRDNPKQFFYVDLMTNVCCDQVCYYCFPTDSQYFHCFEVLLNLALVSVA
ncbi:hypothetical protein [Natrinema caseinilyticum]|uniref:hypothetical protein n=1 Tax=Natrinema caseinilyticum TaxID=2961570 RepID=UPI0020C25747|nr:hypothetical protein [Natrinema caseinilyticum]